MKLSSNEGLLEVASLSPRPRGRGKVYVHLTLCQPHLWEYTGYIVVVITSMHCLVILSVESVPVSKICIEERTEPCTIDIK